MFAHLRRAQLVGDFGERPRHNANILALAVFRHRRAVVQHDATRLHRIGRNLRSEGSFSASSTLGRETSGESIGMFERRTWQFDVPERISGP